ncbi:MAG: hypothetical protein ABI680_02150 [Chthoniobacteraceae bacterium]
MHYPKNPTLVRAIARAVSAPITPAWESLSQSPSWLGNSFPGGGSKTKWVWNFMFTSAVNANGRVFTASHWDRAHRELGIYAKQEHFVFDYALGGAAPRRRATGMSPLLGRSHRQYFRNPRSLHFQTMMKHLLSLLFLFAVVGSSPGATPELLRVYFIGNSVTDIVRYGPLAELAASRGVKIEWGRTMIPGAPLEFIHTHPKDGFREEPYGTWATALKDFAWDSVSLQPFDRHLHGKGDDGKDYGDVPLITEFAQMAARKNPEVQIYIYARWPRVTSGGKGMPFDKNDYDPTKPGSGNDLTKVDDFTERWEARFTGGWDETNESRDYFETLLREVRKETSFLKKKPLLVPVGYVMNELHQRMKAGQVPGYTSIYQFYKDGIHLSEAGSYLVGCSYFATLLKQTPVGLPTAPYGKIDPALAATIQEIVWKVVGAHPEAGVAEH